MKLIKQYIPWVITAVVALFFMFKSCGDKHDTTSRVVKTTDTVYVTKYVKIPEIKQVFVKTKPKPTTVKVVAQDTFRTYYTKYSDSTGVATIIVQDSVKGHLLGQIVSFNVKEREIEYKEKTVTNTIKQKPKFNLALGMKTAVGVNSNIGAEATFKNRNGWSLDLGYNTNNQIMIGIKKDILTLWEE